MSNYFRRRKFCRFTAEGVQEIDYKEFIKECPELRESMWNQNIVLPPMPNAQNTSMVRRESKQYSLVYL